MMDCHGVEINFNILTESEWNVAKTVTEIHIFSNKLKVVFPIFIGTSTICWTHW